MSTVSSFLMLNVWDDHALAYDRSLLQIRNSGSHYASNAKCESSVTTTNAVADVVPGLLQAT